MKRAKEETMQNGVIEVRYYNVVIYVEFKSGEDEYLIDYLQRLVGGDRPVTLKTILNWCRHHNLRFWTKFRIRWDFPIEANVMNLIKYYRVLWDLSRDSE